MNIQDRCGKIRNETQNVYVFQYATGLIPNMKEFGCLDFGKATIPNLHREKILFLLDLNETITFHEITFQNIAIVCREWR